MRFGPAVAVIAFALVACRLPASEHRAEYLGSYEWTGAGGWFGGFSAIELDPDGLGLFALTDRGFFARALIDREAGLIADITVDEWWWLRSSTGGRLSKGITDAEGLDIEPDGTMHISFEGSHRVATYDTPDSAAQVRSRAATFAGMGANKSLEALAQDDQGRLYTLPEGSRDAHGGIPVYRLENDRWTVPFSLPSSRGFQPVGADFGPDGRFYLLERGFSVIGFRTQLRRWSFGADGPEAEATLIRTAFGTHDNLEGLSIWRDEVGILRATMISDDNFKSFQRTEIVEYALPD
ncbi:esterase-like activity of phytase family protein [Phaeobacter marinintestinus]|uniref:esterase-like activity of phytase family protein n=1 Tax=Falsiphaeobacter marinintestinus TaxID=1492905 RepID=UPI0011B5F78F|nr:esterase-like activity of phytase family protein [Phaeobacter marinintestinus]